MSAQLSVFASTLIAVSTNAEARFLSGLPQLGVDDGPIWVVAPGVSTEQLPANTFEIEQRLTRFWNLRQAIDHASTLLVSRETVVVITGAGLLAPAFLLAARRLGLRTIFVESPEWAGKRRRGRLARLADETIVEWEHQLVRHPFATVLGETV